MTSVPVISEVGHVAVRVRDLAAAEEYATAVVGLHVTERSEDSIWLSHGTVHHGIQYIQADEDAVDHIGLVAAGPEALAEIRRRVDAAGLSVVSELPLGPGPVDGFAFETNDGFVLEIYTAMEHLDVALAKTVVRPTRFGHVNFAVPDPAATMKFFIELLDFRVSDYAGDGAFLRCNVDHHGVGVIPGEAKLHHYAWEYPSIVELALIADTIDERGDYVIWGPGRHGIGNNIATYKEEPSKLVTEFYCDMDHIYNDATHVPGTWTFEGWKWMSRWGPGVPDVLFGLGLPFTKRPVAAHTSL